MRCAALCGAGEMEGDAHAAGSSRPSAMLQCSRSGRQRVRRREGAVPGAAAVARVVARGADAVDVVADGGEQEQDDGEEGARVAEGEEGECRRR